MMHSSEAKSLLAESCYLGRDLAHALRGTTDADEETIKFYLPGVRSIVVGMLDKHGYYSMTEEQRAPFYDAAYAAFSRRMRGDD